MESQVKRGNIANYCHREILGFAIHTGNKHTHLLGNASVNIKTLCLEVYCVQNQTGGSAHAKLLHITYYMNEL